MTIYENQKEYIVKNYMKLYFVLFNYVIDETFSEIWV